MVKSLLYGTAILRSLEGHPDKAGTTLLIRHSERPSFDNIPISSWNSIGLTARGVEAAVDFGKALAEDLRRTDLRVYGWGLRRCTDTADAIAQGAVQAGCRILEHKNLRLMSPIADRPSYEKAQLSDHWLETVGEWLGGAEDGPMVPTRDFVPGVLRGLLDAGVWGDGGASVAVTHDLQIMAVASYLLGTPVGWPGFLEGVVLRLRGGEIYAEMGAMSAKMSRERALNPGDA